MLERGTDLFELGCPAYRALSGGILRAHQDFCKLFSTLPTSIFGYGHSKSPDRCNEPRGSCPARSREDAVFVRASRRNKRCTNFRCKLSEKNSTESPSVHSRAGKASPVEMSLRPRFQRGRNLFFGGTGIPGSGSGAGLPVIPGQARRLSHQWRLRSRGTRDYAPRNDMLAGSLTHETEWFPESS